jgi:toxin HigB-1
MRHNNTAVKEKKRWIIGPAPHAAPRRPRDILYQWGENEAIPLFKPSNDNDTNPTAARSGVDGEAPRRKLTVDIGQRLAYVADVIRSFKSKGLAELWENGRTGKIDGKMHARILRRLDRLDVAARPEEMNVPGFDFHALRGFKPTRYSTHVNGPWCITFEFEDGDACRIDFEQYH